MKRSFIIILTLVLTATVFTGCRRKKVEPTTAPTTMPTTAPTAEPTTAPTTRPTTAPTTQPTTPSENETIEGGLGDTQETVGTDEGKSRRMMPRGF